MKNGASICSTESYISIIGFYPTEKMIFFRIFLRNATFSDFWRLILQNHFKDTPREAAAAKPTLLLFFLGRLSGDFETPVTVRYCRKMTRNPRRQFSANPMRTTSISLDK